MGLGNETMPGIGLQVPGVFIAPWFRAMPALGLRRAAIVSSNPAPVPPAGRWKTSLPDPATPE
jgi:hypothetical protein